MLQSADTTLKIERLLRVLTDAQLAGLLIRTPHNFTWLTGGDHLVDRTSGQGVGALALRRDGRVALLADAIETARLREEETQALEPDVIEFPWIESQRDPAHVLHLASGWCGSGPIGTDLAIANAVPVEPQLARARASLTAPEQARLREWGHRAGDALGALCATLRPGMTEREVARLADSAIAAAGGRNVVTMVAADERIARYRHPLPTHAPWHERLEVIVCAQRDGLIVSLTRLVAAGRVDGDLRARTEAAAQVNAALYAATRPETSGAALYRVAQDAYARAGFPGEEQFHHQGGACGYRTRDWVAHPACEERVQPDQAFAWNPSVTGAKVEETVLVTPDGVEIVTASPGWPVLRVEAGGSAYDCPGWLVL